jgi:hypothetical protein
LIERLVARVHAVDVWDGPGDGRPCDGCGRRVTRYQAAVSAIASQWLSVYFHAECYDIWNSERLAVSEAESMARSRQAPGASS